MTQMKKKMMKKTVFLGDDSATVDSSNHEFISSLVFLGNSYRKNTLCGSQRKAANVVIKTDSLSGNACARWMPLPYYPRELQVRAPSGHRFFFSSLYLISFPLPMSKNAQYILPRTLFSG